MLSSQAVAAKNGVGNHRHVQHHGRQGQLQAWSGTVCAGGVHGCFRPQLLLPKKELGTTGMFSTMAGRDRCGQRHGRALSALEGCMGAFLRSCCCQTRTRKRVLCPRCPIKIITHAAKLSFSLSPHRSRSQNPSPPGCHLPPCSARFRPHLARQNPLQRAAQSPHPRRRTEILGAGLERVQQRFGNVGAWAPPAPACLMQFTCSAAVPAAVQGCTTEDFFQCL